MSFEWDRNPDSESNDHESLQDSPCPGGWPRPGSAMRQFSSVSCSPAFT